MRSSSGEIEGVTTHPSGLPTRVAVRPVDADCMAELNRLLREDTDLELRAPMRGKRCGSPLPRSRASGARGRRPGRWSGRPLPRAEGEMTKRAMYGESPITLDEHEHLGKEAEFERYLVWRAERARTGA
jgi:hypothetical protein